MTEHDPTLAKLMAEALAGQTAFDAPDVPEFIPEDAPFDEGQRRWLNGLFTGLHAIASAAKSAPPEPEAGTALSILFGSQSGTAESVSKDLRKFAATQGFDAKIAELDTTTPAALADVRHLLIVAATFGEGEPTDNAVNFHKALMAEDAPKLPATLHYSVCGLGDTSYPHFNKAARDIDERMAALGATRVAPMVPCDVAYDEDYAAWRSEVFAAEAFSAAAGAAQQPAAADEEPKPEFDKNHPFLGTILDVRCLSGEGSAKRVNHIEISLAGGGPDLDYQVGDALGLWPINDGAEVAAILTACGFTGHETVTLKGAPTKLRAALLKMLDLTTVTPKTGEAWGCTIEPECQVIDVLQAGIEGLSPQALVDGLRPLQPRLYSISSSPEKHPGEVHLTVGEVHYDLNGSPRKGVASTYLGARLPMGGSVGVYVQKSGHFHIPADDTVPLIMIGPGTGIAPFRAFLEEREMRGATGKNWLFFGDQHAACDYLYDDEIRGWSESGLLGKLSLAWSRDGASKVYVQHLIEEEGEAFFEWLEAGAAIYVCGDASRMAADVDQAIKAVVARWGDMDDTAAEVYVEALKKDHRYQRDVY
ncbi:MAG: flavodoxin domain-containing protein [Pseudomonadota bacterium]